MSEPTTDADLERRLAAAEAALREKGDLETALRRSEELRRIAVEGARMGTWRWDLRDELIWGDAAFLSLWGFPPSDEPRRLSDFTDRMSPEGQAEMGEIVASAVAAGKEFDGQLAVVSGPTNGRWIRWRGRAEREQPWIVNGVSFDVTAQYAGETRLRESEERLQGALAISTVGVLFWGPDFRLTQVNDAFLQLTGFTREEAIGKTWQELTPPEFHPASERAVEELRNSVETTPLEKQNYRRDGSRWWGLFAPRRLSENEVVEFVIDVSERRQAETALRESEQRQAFLLTLSDAFRAQTSPEGIGAVATRMAAEQLNADRCYIAHLPRGEGRGRIGSEYWAPGLAPLAGERRFEEFPEAMKRLESGPLVIRNLSNDESLSDADKRSIGTAMGLHGLLAAVLRKGEGNHFWCLTAATAEPRNWTDGDLRLLEEIAERTWAAMERTGSETALRESEAKYRTVFESIDEGFAILELIDDERGRAVDYRYLEVNPAFERQSGVSKVVGKRVSEIVPGLEDSWFETYDRVCRTGEPERVEDYNISTGRWYDVHIARFAETGSRRFCIVFNNVTERKRAEQALRESEERQAFLLRLSDESRPQTDADAVAATACRLLAEWFDASQVRYTIVEGGPGEEVGGVLGEHVRRGQGLPRRYPFAAFGEGVLSIMRTGRTLVIPDTETDPRITPEGRGAFRSVGCRASVTATLLKGGRITATLAIQDDKPRDWTDENTALVDAVAERTWAAIERARAEEVLRESEERQAFLLKLNDAIRPLAEPVEVQKVALRLLAEHLGLSRAAYSEIEDDHDRAHRVATYDGDLPPVPRDVRISDLSADQLACYLDGRPFVVSDTETDERVAATREACRAIQVRAWIGVPLVKSGQLLTVLGVEKTTPHAWTDAEVRLVEEAAERTWAASERGRIEVALRASEERLRGFGDASQDILWIRDAETLQWQYLTPAFEAIYGLSREEALAGNNYRNWLELILPEDRAHAMENIRRVKAGEQVAFEFRIRRPSDGAIRWMRNMDFPIFDEAGTAALIGGIGHDFTELRETELRLQALIEGIPQLVWRAGAPGLWTWASPQWTAFTGQQEVDSHGWGWLEPLHPDDRGAAREAWSQAAGRGDLQVECRIGDRGKAYRWFQARAVPVRDKDGEIVEWLGTSTDIHDLRLLQGRQQVMVQELQHRTRNLITVVDVLSKQTLKNAASLRDFDHHFGDRLSALSRVQGLLSHLSAGKRVTFDELLGSELAALGAPDDKVTLDGPKGVPLRSATVQTFSLALHELATNALKYGALAAPDGHLTVRWEVTHPDRGGPRLQVDWRETGVVLTHVDDRPLGGGYGRELIEHALPYQLDADTTYELTADGVHCTIDVPASTVRAGLD